MGQTANVYILYLLGVAGVFWVCQTVPSDRDIGHLKHKRSGGRYVTLSLKNSRFTK